MAKLVVPRGPLGLKGVKSAQRESRIVSCGTKVVGAGVPSFGYTPRASQEVRLLNVQLFIEPVAYAAGLFLLVRVLTGFDQPATAEAILLWENVLPVLQEPSTDVDLLVHSGRSHMSWDMNISYKRIGRRFGIWTRGMAGMTGPTFASFEISES